jgi:hypothetical protein
MSYSEAQSLPDAPSSAISRLESGDRERLTVPLLVALCVRYKLRLDHLLLGWRGWNDEPPTEPPVGRPPTESGDVLAVNLRTNLRAARLRTGRGTVVVARDIGIGQPILFKYEQGKHRMPIGVAYALAGVLGVTDFMALLAPPERTEDDHHDQPAGG